MYYINIFLIYSILGNLFERVLVFIRHKDYVSGFMGTIFTPVYGIAIIVIMLIHNKIKIKNILLKLLVETIIYGIILSILEFVGGVLIEFTFNKIYWNYDSFKYNIGKYISLECALLWGIMSTSVIYLIHPIMNKIEKYIPKLITISISIFFLINLIYVFVSK